jgi:hypothetical protein
MRKSHDPCTVLIELGQKLTSLGKSISHHMAIYTRPPLPTRKEKRRPSKK